MKTSPIMLLKTKLWVLTCFLLGSVITFAHEHPNGETCSAEHKPALSFIPNQGQWETPIAYKAPMGGLDHLYLELDGFTYQYFDPTATKELHEVSEDPLHKTVDIKGHVHRVKFLGAQTPTLSGWQKRTGVYNYLIGNDASKWASQVPHYAGVHYDELYEGIDLKAYNNDLGFKYDFIVAPGADPNQIKLAYEGVDGIELNYGSLLLETSLHTIVELEPYAYQVIWGRKVTVPCNYVLEGNEVHFEFPQGYQEGIELIIDPVVVAATLSGTVGSANFGHTACFDPAENVYGGGISFGPGYPTTTGAFQTTFGGGSVDFCISKYNPDGTNLIYATYIGGNGSDYPHSIIADNNQQLYVYGSSTSNNFPTTPNAYQTSNGGSYDVVVAILSQDGGSLVGSSYFGGNQVDGLNESFLNSNYGDTYRGEIVLDNQNNIYVISSTQSNNFPTTPGAYDETKGPGGFPAQDAVVFKANSNLSVLFWSTFLGSDNAADIGNGIRVNDDGEVYVTGTAGEGNFPTTAGSYAEAWPGGQENAYVAKFSADGTTLLASTYYGSFTGDEHAFFLDIDEDDQVHIYGQTTGVITPTPNTYSSPTGSRQFLAAFNEDLDALAYQTVIGNGNGFGYDFVPVAFMVDKCNGIYFSGYYATAGLPTTPDAVQVTSDAFYLGVLTPNAEDLEYGTYYGNANHVDGGTSRFDKKGTVYQAVCSCLGSEMNTLPGAWAQGQVDFCDLGVFKIDLEIDAVTANGAILPATAGCAPFDVDFVFTGANSVDYEWYVEGNLEGTDPDFAFTFDDPGVYEIMLIATNLVTCNITDTFFTQIDVLSQTSTVTDTTTCGTEDLFLDVTTPNATYSWQDGTTNPTYVVTDIGTYWVDVTLSGGACTRRDSFIVNPATNFTLDLGPDTSFCDVPSVMLDVFDPLITSYEWQDGTGASFYEVVGSGLYTVNVTDSLGCEYSDQVDITFASTPFFSLPEDTILCQEDVLEVDNPFPGTPATWSDGSSGNNITVSSEGTYTLILDNNGCEWADSIQIDYYNALTLITDTDDPSCPGDCDGIIIADPGGGAGTGYTFNWDNTLTGDFLEDLCAGTYQVTLSDAAGCEEVFETSLFEEAPLETDYVVKDVTCPGDQDGRIFLTGAAGGVPPYEYFFNDVPTFDTLIFNGLSGGEYLITLEDANGCVRLDTLVVFEPEAFAIDAGENQFVELGTEIRLDGIVAPYTTQVLSWTPNDWLDCDDCLQPELTPLESTWFTLRATDPESGCFLEDRVLVQVKRDVDIYIPNIFSPDDDGQNDRFTIFADPGVELIEELKVFDRWGEMVYINEDFFPNNPEIGWDGTLDGRDMNPGVFVYTANIRMVDGRLETRKGSITLVR